MIRSYQPTTIPDFQIDPQHPVLLQVQQASPAGDWREVGYVWTVGASRTSSTEHWYLYASAPAGNAARGAYAWAGYEASGRVVGTTLRLVPVSLPPGQDPSTFKTYLEREHGVTLTYVKGSMSSD